MFGSDALEIAIGLIVFFLIVSLICSAIREAIETILKTRARYLERGMRELLDDPTGATLAKSLFEHGQIFSLFAGSYDPAKLSVSWKDALARPYRLLDYWRARRQLPSYIPAGQFAAALMDIVARGPGDWPYPVKSGPMSADQLRAQAAYLPSVKLQRTVLSAIDFGENDLAKIKTNLERWFDGSMDRVSGWYKRGTQLWLFAIGLVLAVAMNLDALTVTDRLVSDKVMRAAFLKQAETIQREGVEAQPKSIGGLRDELNQIGAPIGWKNGKPGPQHCPQLLPSGACDPNKRVDKLNWLWIIAGWLITAGAVTFGAPFWFDALNKFMVIRSTVKPREKSPEEASEDRQRGPAPSKRGVQPGRADTGADAKPPAGRKGAPGGASAQMPAADLAPAEAGFEPESWKVGFANPGEKAL